MSAPSLISIHRDGEDFGPYAEDEIKQHIASGSLVPSDLAWHEGLENWQPLGSLPELEACFSQSAATAPPITPVHTRLQFPTSEALRTQPDPEGQPTPPLATNLLNRPMKGGMVALIIVLGIIALWVAARVFIPELGPRLSLGVSIVFIGFIIFSGRLSGRGGGSGGSSDGSGGSSCGGGGGCGGGSSCGGGD